MKNRVNKSSFQCKVVNKHVRRIKITTLLLFCLSCCLIAKNTHYQDVSLSLNLHNVTIENAVNEIEKKIDFKFVFTDKAINASHKTTIRVSNGSLVEVLNQLIRNTDLEYRIVRKQIILSKKSQEVSQKSKKISGTVTDPYGEPVTGANVMEKGTTNGVITDLEGKFVLNVEEQSVIQIKYIGYIMQEFVPGNKTEFHLILQEDLQNLDEVVVIGYGTQKKRDLTGAVSSIKLEDTPLPTVSTISHVLAGKAAGLQVNTVSAQPGGGASYRIRGAASISAGNDPLIIIDGFPVKDPGGLNAGRYSDG
ncbi:MAG: carboxypeptidase-like regulatory domain-containing protein, partial [Tannerella sp.]|nr:carboxypeptidase-like regulatory domain-containing protein [Tannerella sp.]